jgi:hypothetical protein
MTTEIGIYRVWSSCFKSEDGYRAVGHIDLVLSDDATKRFQDIPVGPFGTEADALAAAQEAAETRASELDSHNKVEPYSDR